MDKQTKSIFLVLLILIIGGAILWSARSPMTDSEINTQEVNQPVEQDRPDQEEMVTDDEMEESEQPQTIVSVAVADDRFETLVTALQEAELVETLSGEGPFTVFAPTDQAFDKLPEGTLESLLQDKARLTEVLTYHVVSGRVMASDVAELSSTQTLQGQDLMIDTSDGVMVDDAQVVMTDIETSNGVIHVIDTVSIPE